MVADKQRRCGAGDTAAGRAGGRWELEQERRERSGEGGSAGGGDSKPPRSQESTATCRPRASHRSSGQGRARPGCPEHSHTSKTPSFLHSDSQPTLDPPLPPSFHPPCLSQDVYGALTLGQPEFQALGAQRGATKGDRPHPSSLVRGQTTPEQPISRSGESASSGRCLRGSWGGGGGGWMPGSYENERCSRQLRTVPWGVTPRPTQYLRQALSPIPRGSP